MGKNWQGKRKNEHYYKKAKKEGYRSRAAYKLRQLNDKFGVIETGDVVVDLGAAPGSWLQFAREVVGESGFLLGVDLEEIDDLDYENVKTIQGDITEDGILDLIRDNLSDFPDVILSDASPDITGIWDVDHARSVDLCRSMLGIAKEILKPGGSVMVKVFQGEFYDDLVKEFDKNFDYRKSSKPKASRKRSAEMYIIGKGFSP